MDSVRESKDGSVVSEEKWNWRTGRESVGVDDEEWSKMEEEDARMADKKLARFSVGWDKKSVSGASVDKDNNTTKVYEEGLYKMEEEERKSVFGTKIGIVKKKMTTPQSLMNVVPSEKRVSQWEELMRKFSEAHKEECKTVSLDIPRAPRSVKQFPTGSQYEGTWDVLGMSGYGIYTFPNGVIYEGEFEDGMFHGAGELRYPSGIIIRGVWKKGEVTERTLVFADGLEYREDDWKYCRMPDRRFTIEYENGLQALGKSYLTADQPTRQIPTGFYDTGDGFYDPKTKTVYSADDLTAIVRSPCPREQKWIIENCRTSIDESLGPRTELYEEWSEPQIDPQPPPPPAAASRAYGPRKSEMYDEDRDIDDEACFYEVIRKSRTSFAPIGRWREPFYTASDYSPTCDSFAPTSP